MIRTPIRIDDYDFELPEHAIAQSPAESRTASRLLVWREDGTFEHGHFGELPRLLRRGDLLVLNDTRVFAARLFGRKSTGGARVEALLVRPRVERGQWEALLRPGRRLPPGTVVDFESDVHATVGEVLGEGLRVLHFEPRTDVFDLCATQGHVPLPPYVARDDAAQDVERYQTVYARQRGSVAAPTAGLHFDQELLERIRSAGVDIARLTLHVGPGTFQPIDDDRLAKGELHRESIEIPAETVARLRAQREFGGRIIAVGTTVCRSLESLSEDELQANRAVRRDTRLLIAPGFEFRFVDALVTNFHLPKSSLLLLVAALAGERWREAYALAVREGYRFYSYGDANWIERPRV